MGWRGSACIDEKEKFLIYKEIQSGAVSKSYMRKGFLIYEEMLKYFPIYEDADIILDTSGVEDSGIPFFSIPLCSIFSFSLYDGARFQSPLLLSVNRTLNISI